MRLHQQFQSRSAIQQIFRRNRAQEALHQIMPGADIAPIKRHGAAAEQAVRPDKHLVGRSPFHHAALMRPLMVVVLKVAIEIALHRKRSGNPSSRMQSLRGTLL